MRQIFLDTETTGLDAGAGDRVIEIGLIEMVNRRRTGDDRHWYLNPQRSSHPDAVRVHGLSDDFLADKPLFESIVEDLLAYLSGAEVVIHNSSFDLGFLDAELQRVGKPGLTQHVAGVVDTLQMARELYPGKANNLDALCKRLEVDNSGRNVHGALLDAGLLAEVYIRLTRGQDSLVIESDDVRPGLPAAARVDLSAFELPVLLPSEEEAAAHEAMLADLDDASHGKTVWRRVLA
jgi:DNA polymerase-3 subunit epsilon